MRERGFARTLLRRSGLFIFWLACFLSGIVTAGPYRPYVIGAFIGFFAAQLMAIRASHAFWPVMERFIDWPKVEARLQER